MADVTVPNLVGIPSSQVEAQLSAVGLTAGATTQVSSSTVPAGSVVSTTPKAGDVVAEGSAVALEESSGPEKRPIVPDVVDLAQSEAEAKLQTLGLKGVASRRVRHLKPAGTVLKTTPAPGELADPEIPVEMELSAGPTVKQRLEQYVPLAFSATFGLVILGLVATSIFNKEFLANLANKDVARGLITFFIAIATIGVAIILAISTTFGTAEEGDSERSFDRGKQVLTSLIGVLGTIVGFYFGATDGQGESKAAEPKIITNSLPVGTAGAAYLPTMLTSSGLRTPLEWSVDPALPENLELNKETGIISGTPSKVMPATHFVFTAVDSAAPPASAKADLTLEIKQSEQ